MFSLKIEKMKIEYIEDVYKEMRGRSFTEDEIPRVIAKTGFLEALDLYPEAQLHFAIKDAVNEILEIAAKKPANKSQVLLCQDSHKLHNCIFASQKSRASVPARFIPE